ncbi:MAG TPA: hypothetical protein VHU90_09075 [Galbitalea sp.]|jgi:hypothetical protein|nr:hypothetical protein [Galbitalea sp.]
MFELAILRLLSIASILFAFALTIFAMTTRFSPPIPGYLAFLFVGLLGSSAERSVRALQRRVAALEARK